jgi:DNA repair protein RadC
MIKMTDWAEKDRPREKLLAKGARELSDAELLAVILGSGSQGNNVLMLAQKILAMDSTKALNGLFDLELKRLRALHGIGPAKLSRLMASIELARRLKYSERHPKKIIRSSQEAYECLYSQLDGLVREEFWVIFLNRGNRILGFQEFGKGGLSSTVVDVRLILKEAIGLSASSLILAHNHPSGNLQPSGSDKSLTRKIHDSAEIMDIRVLDHLILSSEGYFSFADEGLL